MHPHPGTPDNSENGASSVPDPGGPPDEQDPGKVPASSIPEETDVPRQNNTYTSLEDGTDVQVLDSSAPDNESTTARIDRVLAILLLTLIYILNS